MGVQQSEQQLSSFKSEIEVLQKQWELDRKEIEQATEREQEKLQEQVTKHNEIISGILIKLQSSEQALYGWLNKNKTGWEASIGKVFSEAVLFNEQLAPRQSGAPNTSFYGIELNLDEVNISVKTLAEYEIEKQQWEQMVAAAQKQLDGLQAAQNDKLDKLRKKYQPQIKAGKDGVMEQQFVLEQATAMVQQLQLEIKDVEIKASADKQRALQEMEDLMYASQELLIHRRQELQRIEEELGKQIKAREKEHGKKVTVIEEQLKSAEMEIQLYITDSTEKYKHEKLQLQTRLHDELKGKGVDTHRVKAIEKSIEELSAELNEIEKLRDVVAEYKKDKRELIDKIEENKNRKLLLDQQVQNETEKHRLQRNQVDSDIELLDEDMQTLRESLKQAEDDYKAFVQFQGAEAYQSTEAAYKELKDLYKTDKRCKVLIDELSRSFYTSIKRLDDLKEAANSFLGNFSKQNIFKFNTALNYKLEYQEFAEQLNDFIHNDKIDEFEKRINERFATIIHSVGRETQDLMSKGGEIQTVINNINKDFDHKNFVGAIKKIELRLDESANKVVQLLISIKKFNDEHIFDIGGMNLFSSADQPTKNKKAVDLLKQLGKAIGESKKETIALSDSFELKFRVEENQNDTGWVEKLSNVGSEGTDVLVKAMINIMLLNVFKEGASKRFKDFRLHCMMDEIGKLHPNNVKGILQFANDRNILLINGSPTETNALDYRHIYKLEKDDKRFTRIKRIITNYAQT